MDESVGNLDLVYFIKASSVYQMFNGLSYVFKDKNIDNKNRKIIIGYKSFWKNNLNQFYLEKLEKIKAEIVDLDEFKKLYNYYYCTGLKKVYINIKGGLIDLRKAKDIVIIDDGLGSYRKNYFHSYEVYKREKYQNLGVSEKVSVFRYIARKIILDFVYKVYSVPMHRMFKISGNKFIVDRDYVTSFKEVLNYFDTDKVRIEGESKFVVFYSQPYMDLKIFSEEFYGNFLKKLNSLISDNGFRLVIKKHPGDLYDYGDYFTVSGDYIAESFVLSNRDKIEYAFSFGSTTLINSSVLFDLKCYRIAFRNEGKVEGPFSVLFDNYTHKVFVDSIVDGSFRF
jgi:hypothetical protein